MQPGRLPPFSSIYSGWGRTSDLTDISYQVVEPHQYLDSHWDSVTSDSPECPSDIGFLLDDLNQQHSLPSLPEISDYYLSPAVINSVSDSLEFPSDSGSQFDNLNVQLPSSVAEINDRIPETALDDNFYTAAVTIPTYPTYQNCSSPEDSETLDQLLDDLYHLEDAELRQQQQELPATVQDYNNEINSLKHDVHRGLKRKFSDSDIGFYPISTTDSEPCKPAKKRKKQSKKPRDEVSSSSNLTPKAIDERQRQQEYK